MITIHLQIEIQAPPGEVLDLLADHTQQPRWHPYISGASWLTDGPVQEGSRGITVGRFMGRTVENGVIYHDCGRPRHVSGGSTSGGVVGRMDTDFVPTDGRTRIDCRLQVEFKGLMGLVEPLVEPALERQYREALEALRDFATKCA